MSDAPRDARSFQPIEPADLARLAELAVSQIEFVCRPGNKSIIYRDRLALLCLCQGAALHHRQVLDGVPLEEQRGIHDFDVWGFFRAHPDGAFPVRWRGEVDFGLPHFGRRPEDPHLIGRKVDVLGRSIPIGDGEAPIDAVLRWVTHGGGSSPGLIAARPIFVVSPGPDFGRMIWPR